MFKKLELLLATIVVIALASCGGADKPREQGPKMYPVVAVPVKNVTGYSNFPSSIQLCTHQLVV